MKKEEEERILVTDDNAMRQGGILSSTDKEILKSVKTGEGTVTIKSMEELQEMAKAAVERFDEFKKLCRHMTRRQAKIVRKLRCKQKFTWRAVAEACYRFGWGKWHPPSNQLMGMALCERAAELLGEDYRVAPWN